MAVVVHRELKSLVAFARDVGVQIRGILGAGHVADARAKRVEQTRDGAGYRWRLQEVDGPLEETGDAALADPEDAFWAAWSSIEAAA